MAGSCYTTLDILGIYPPVLNIAHILESYKALGLQPPYLNGIIDSLEQSNSSLNLITILNGLIFMKAMNADTNYKTHGA